MITDDLTSPRSGVVETPGKNAATDAGLAAIQAATEKPRRARGRPRAEGADAGGIGALKSASAEMSPEMQRIIQAQLEYCYDPKAWGALLSVPCPMMLAKTGHKHWLISEGEKDTLGACGSVAARFLMISNPRTLAAMMIGSALFAVYVPRFIEELKIRSDEKKAAEKKA